MKKIIFSLVVLSLLVQFPLFATETEQEAMSATLTNQSAGVPAGAPGVSMSQPAGMPTPGTGSMGTMGAHMQNQMVLTNDGSVILFMGWRMPRRWPLRSGENSMSVPRSLRLTGRSLRIRTLMRQGSKSWRTISTGSRSVRRSRTAPRGIRPRRQQHFPPRRAAQRTARARAGDVWPAANQTG